MAEKTNKQRVAVVGAGPVGALAALYAASRGDDVHVYELRGGKGLFHILRYLSLVDGNASHMFLMFMINGGLRKKQQLREWQSLIYRLLDLLVPNVV